MWKVARMRDLMLLIGLFAGAVAVAVWVHPLLGLAFLVLAKLIEQVWQNAAPAFREAYRAGMTVSSKPKRKHILTDDGEALEVIVDAPDEMPERMRR